MIMNTLATVGLNQNAQFGDLTCELPEYISIILIPTMSLAFLTAAGFAGAAILYNLGSAPFVHNQYTIPSFQIPTTIQNGTIFTNTTALKSDPGCVSVNVCDMCLRDSLLLIICVGRHGATHRRFRVDKYGFLQWLCHFVCCGQERDDFVWN